ncbi:MAG: FtsX-like permease family protein [Massilibacteroides sp.]|nr:FtsX-like permease family protein [Massilibacteroides sp.]
MMILSLAWKNIWRNKKRSLIVMTSVMLGTTAGLFTLGLTYGMVGEKLDAVVYTELSHLQIHQKTFLRHPEITKTLPHVDSIMAFLNVRAEVKTISPHIRITAMGSTSRGNTSLDLLGVDPTSEQALSNLNEHILPGSGHYLNSDEQYPILISDKTAEQLRIKTYTIKLDKTPLPLAITTKLQALNGKRFFTKKKFKRAVSNVLTEKEVSLYGPSLTQAALQYRHHAKIVFTFTDATGLLVSQLFSVCGIFKTDFSGFDEGRAFVLRKDLAKASHLPRNQIHEICVLLHQAEALPTVVQDLKTTFPDVDVQDWKALSPIGEVFSQMMGLYSLMVMGFILFALAFGIVNTMLMAILERTKELGMLMAIGMNRRRVFQLIMSETIFLTLVGAFVGMVLGAALIAITHHTGIYFSSIAEGFQEMGFAAVVYPTIGAQDFIIITLLVILTGILSAIYPARKALKLNPLEAIRTEN